MKNKKSYKTAMFLLAISVATAMSSCQNTQHDSSAVDAEEQVESVVYACPMHPEVTEASPGDCPKCGMHLAEITNDQSDEGHSETSMSSSFKVFGNCGMCKVRIEKAALSVKGVKKAVWEKQTGMLRVSYGENFDLTPVYKAVAGVGHDTEVDKAPDGVYNKLHACCHYRSQE